MDLIILTTTGTQRNENNALEFRSIKLAHVFSKSSMKCSLTDVSV